ncbi:hypothetical protein E2C01_068295 [Portunus trituberculatus]|uniref:Uncharacterized protein n=1 Tax=Portunus trituberculatus TaxID=210409 RepID=A0A5B7HRJ3_PORTR|nr:hypothetical protein [Portunus trituberculatus]
MIPRQPSKAAVSRLAGSLRHVTSGTAPWDQSKERVAGHTSSRPCIAQPRAMLRARVSSDGEWAAGLSADVKEGVWGATLTRAQSSTATPTLPGHSSRTRLAAKACGEREMKDRYRVTCVPACSTPNNFPPVLWRQAVVAARLHHGKRLY